VQTHFIRLAFFAFLPDFFANLFYKIGIFALRMKDTPAGILTTVIFCAFEIFRKTVLQTVSPQKTICKIVLQKRKL